MDARKLRTYTVEVHLTFVFRDIVEVAAASEQQAKELAIEEAQCDWSESQRTQTRASLIAVEEP